MRTRLRRIDLDYSIEFAQPAFLLLTSKYAVAEALATSLAPLYGINSGDVRVVESSSLDDIEIKIDLFNRNGQFSFGANSLRIKFKNITSKGDGEIVTKVLEAALKGMGSFLANLIIRQEVIVSNITYEAIEGPHAIRSYFEGVRFSDYLKQSNNVGFKVVEFTEKPKRTLALDISPSWSDEKGVFVTANRFSDLDLTEPIRDRLNSLIAAIETLLPKLNFNVEQSENWK